MVGDGTLSYHFSPTQCRLLFFNICSKVTIMILDKIKKYFLIKKAHKKAEEEEKRFNKLPQLERLAYSTYSWVSLNWNGHKEKFLINNINVVEITASGKYPNIMLSFIERIKDMGANVDDKDLEIDTQKMVAEQYQLYEEVARKSMVNPTFDEVYNAIVNMREARGFVDKAVCVSDVIPSDFLIDLYNYHIERWSANIKKKSEQLTLTGSEELENISTKPPQATSRS